MPRDKIAAMVIVIVGVIVIGAGISGFDSETSAEPTVQAFLLDWQQQNYDAAGSLTTGPATEVATMLRSTFRQLDATALFLTMNSVVQHGTVADARFTAQVDLAEEGRVWTYSGHFRLVKNGSDWRVAWRPSVIVPGLEPGDRLAVVTSYPARAPVLDATGQPLQQVSGVDEVGVIPGRLTRPAATATGFAAATGVDPNQVAGQIAAAPPGQFLKLATLAPAKYLQLRARLAHVPGLMVRQTQARLYKSVASELVGSVGSEVDPQLRGDGALYLPGTTIGLTGLEAAFQRQLLGTPATSIVVLNSSGETTAVLYHWAGTAGTPVRTTIEPSVQRAAITALASGPYSGELVAVQASTGKILAIAQHVAGAPLPAGGVLNARLAPGTAFTIVSAAALLESGLSVDTPISCTNSFTVGGETFTSYGTGVQKPFSADFADDCGTAFAGLSERLNPDQFAGVVRDFRLGTAWPALPVPVFSGMVPAANGQAGLAAETIGKGGVEMSPLAMAMVAAEVDSGTWHPPSVLADAGPSGGGGVSGGAGSSGAAGVSGGAGSSGAAGVSGGAGVSGAAPLDPGSLTALRGLMWGAVHSGAARAARVPGAPVYGQVGMTRSGSEWLSWFVGYRGDVAFTIIEAAYSPQASAASLARAFAAALR